MKKFLVDDMVSYEYDTSNMTVGAFTKMLKECEKEIMEKRKGTHVRFDFLYLSTQGDCEIKIRYKRRERMNEKLISEEEDRALIKKEESAKKRSQYTAEWFKKVMSGRVQVTNDYNKAI